MFLRGIGRASWRLWSNVRVLMTLGGAFLCGGQVERGVDEGIDGAGGNAPK